LKSLFKYLIFSIIFFFLGKTSFAQTSISNDLDSLNIIINTKSNHDTLKVQAYLSIAEILYTSNIDTLKYFNEKVKYISIAGIKSTKNKKVKLSFQHSLASAYSNIGYVYENRGNIPKAMDYYYKALKINEQIGNELGIAVNFNNIADTYRSQGYNSKAMTYFLKSLKLYKKNKDIMGEAMTLNNIASVYLGQNDTKNAIQYYEQSLNIVQVINNKYGEASILSNLGSIYLNEGDTTKALKLYMESLEINTQINDKLSIINSLINVGNVQLIKGEVKKAKKHITKAFQMATKNGFPKAISRSSSFLSKIAIKEHNYKEAFNKYKLSIVMGDSIRNNNSIKALAEQNAKYEYEKQALADSITYIKELKIQEALLQVEETKNEQQQQQKYYLYFGLFLLVLFTLFIFNRFKVTQKQKIIIEQAHKKTEHQKKQVEKAHKEITDSINYAERIQRSFLATDEILTSNLGEYFVFFKPKDVVSGDFYWADMLSNGKFAIVNADSTGHGVPGAIMSLLNTSSIEKSIDKGLLEPADIFNDARKNIIKRLKKDGSEHGGKDGMDASIICFDFNNLKMAYCAAQNPIWIIRNEEVIQIKPEKMPIGKHDNDQTPFVGGEFDLQKGDQVYTLTDGFQDQFGGPKGKKFMVKRMRQFVLENSKLSMTEQHVKLKQAFMEWQGNLEQVDDVCVIGIRV